MKACEADDCAHRFCRYCLAVHLGIDTEAASSSSFKGTPWHCPTCSSKCCCSQPECTTVHRHCKAHRYRCLRAAKRKEQSDLQKLYDAQQALMPPPPPPPPPPPIPALNLQRKKEARQQKEEARAKAALKRQQKEEARSKTLTAIAEYMARQATSRDAKASLRRKARAAKVEARARKAKARAAQAEDKALAAKLTGAAHQKHVHEIAAQVALTLTKPGMRKACCESLVTGPPGCQAWVELVTNHRQDGEPPETEAKVDIEGNDQSEPYVVTVCDGTFVKTWKVNPLPLGPLSTLRQCRVRISRVLYLFVSGALSLSLNLEP